MTFTWTIYTVLIMIFFYAVSMEDLSIFDRKNKHSWRYVNIYSP